MTGPAIAPILNEPAIPKVDKPAKVRDAAQQFEALLLGQILQTVSEAGGWLGSGADSASGCATSLAEQQLAILLARQGGMGLGKLIETGLKKASGGSG